MTTVLDVLQEEFAAWVERQKRIVQVTSFERAARFEGDQSQHIFGLGADFIGTMPQLVDVAADARGQGYFVVWEPDHLHVQRFQRGFLARCGLFA